MRLGFGIDGTLTPQEEIDLAIRAEQAGLESCVPVVNLYLRDGITTAAAVLARTETVRVATGTMSTFHYHPVVIAITAGRLQALGTGRVVLVLATGTPEALERANIRLDRPLRHIREAVAILRRLYAGGRTDFAGDIFTVRGYRLSAVPAPVPPIWVAAMGPKMLELAGEVADGVLLPAAAPPEYVPWAIECLARGAAKAGRTLDGFEIACNVVVEADAEATGWPNARRLIAFHLSSPFFDPVTAPAGVAVDRPAIKSAFERRDWAEIRRLVPDRVLRRFAAIGSGKDCLHALGQYARLGLTLPIALPVGGGADQLASMSSVFTAYRSSADGPR